MMTWASLMMTWASLMIRASPPGLSILIIPRHPLCQVNSHPDRCLHHPHSLRDDDPGCQFHPISQTPSSASLIPDGIDDDNLGLCDDNLGLCDDDLGLCDDDLGLSDDDLGSILAPSPNTALLKAYIKGCFRPSLSPDPSRT
jgi:hypothetical protein